jgi:hypothetical protein
MVGLSIARYTLETGCWAMAISEMPFDPQGGWYPRMSEKQLEVFNSTARALLVEGPRKSGKTLGALHKIIRHMFETAGASVAMFSKTMKKSKDGGTWVDINNIILPEWVKANIGLRITTLNNEGKPGFKIDGQTRTPYFKIRNRHGGESECRLFSLDKDEEIEDKIKEQRFSCIYFSELSSFRSRLVLSVALPQLRMPHLSIDEQFWMADTNPSEDGEHSWIYEVWFIERVISYEDYKARNEKKGLPVVEEGAFLSFQKGLEVITILPSDNPFIDPRELDELKTQYAYDKGLYDRYVLGKWIFGDGDASLHFRRTFRRTEHVIGVAEDESEPESWIVALPSPTSYEIITGWDIGERNHAASFLDKASRLNAKPIFVVIDELVSIGKDVSVADFTIGAVELTNDIEYTTGKKFDYGRAWSDRSSIEKYSATADTYPYLEVLAASEDRFFLQGVPKPKGSVRVRVQIVKQLLFHKRLFVSAHCFHTIAMLENLRRGLTPIDYVVNDDYKHIFDALSYALLMECAEDLFRTPKSLASSPASRPLIEA